MLQCADIALYEAKGKAKGEGQISLFETQMEARVKRRTLIEHALANPQRIAALQLQYQPIFTLRTNQLVGYEALARWSHPALGEIAPSEFIDVAERSGKARMLTLHLFRKAVADALSWPDDLSLSFNLSGSGLCTAGFEVSLPQIADELGFSTSRLVLEVTETALLADP
jgi:predicted signal transduction protein with EAL and GGDEF domain